MINTDYELLHPSNKPERVKLLLMDESPGTGEGFYQANTNLFNQTMTAFRLGTGEAHGRADFLDYFRSCGCYLDYLCLESVNDLPESERVDRYGQWVDSLTARLRAYNPQFLVCVRPEIEAAVRQAASQAGIPVQIFDALPFPAQGASVLGYQRGLAALLRRTGILGMR